MTVNLERPVKVSLKRPTKIKESMNFIKAALILPILPKSKTPSQPPRKAKSDFKQRLFAKGGIVAYIEEDDGIMFADLTQSQRINIKNDLLDARIGKHKVQINISHMTGRVLQ